MGKKKARRVTKASSKRATKAAEPEPEPEPEPVESDEEAVPKKRAGRQPKTSTASTTASKPRAKRKTAAEKRAEEAAAAALAADDSLELPPDEDPDASIVAIEPSSAPVRGLRSRSSSKAQDEVRATKPLPRKARSRKTTQNDTEALIDAPVRDTRSAPTRKAEEPIMVPLSQPLSSIDLSNIPPPTPPPKSKARGKERECSPSVVHAVANLVTAVSGQPSSTALAQEDRGVTLEEFVRRQFRQRHDQLREQGEAAIVAWEDKAREGRERVEKAFAS